MHQRKVTVKTCSMLIATCLLTAGCTSTTTPRPNGPVPVAHGSVSAFTALVPSSAGVADCVGPGASRIDADATAVGMVYDRPVPRQITVLLDGAGVPTGYIDVRGDLSVSDESVGDLTTIALYLNSDYAVLSNRPRAGEPSVLEVPLSEAYSSERLGNPGAVIQRVLEACGSAV
jgi:hypothetical protein